MLDSDINICNVDTNLAFRLRFKLKSKFRKKKITLGRSVSIWIIYSGRNYCYFFGTIFEGYHYKFILLKISVGLFLWLSNLAI